MKSLQRLAVFAICLMIVASLAEVAGKAAVTISTPNSSTVNYTLTPGATSSPITPATNQATLIMSSNNGTSNFGVSTITLVHIQSVMLRWVGIESQSGVIVHNGSTTVGTHIVYLDNNHQVALQVFSADQFVIHNASTASQSGTVKLIW